MKRLSTFALLGPALMTLVVFVIVLPTAEFMEAAPMEITILARQYPTIVIFVVFAALVIALFDWINELIEIPFRPVATAIAGWLLAAWALRGLLALPDVPGWFIAVGMAGAIPAFACSWFSARISKMN